MINLTNKQLSRFGNFLSEVIFEYNQDLCYLRFYCDELEYFFDCGYEIKEGVICSYYSDSEYHYYFDEKDLGYCIQKALNHCNEIDENFFNN